jgi:hypothetical protein
MAVKFKIAFTIDAKTLFAYLSQALPTLQDLHVEEVIERPIQETFGNLVKPKIIKKTIKSKTKTFNLTEGLNKILISVLSDGEVHYTNDFNEQVLKTKYAINSIQSRLASLKKYGVVMQPRTGHWQLTKEYQDTFTHKES